MRVSVGYMCSVIIGSLLSWCMEEKAEEGLGRRCACFGGGGGQAGRRNLLLLPASAATSSLCLGPSPHPPPSLPWRRQTAGRRTKQLTNAARRRILQEPQNQCRASAAHHAPPLLPHRLPAPKLCASPACCGVRPFTRQTPALLSLAATRGRWGAEGTAVCGGGARYPQLWGVDMNRTNITRELGRDYEDIKYVARRCASTSNCLGHGGRRPCLALYCIGRKDRAASW